MNQYLYSLPRILNPRFQTKYSKMDLQISYSTGSAQLSGNILHFSFAKKWKWTFILKVKVCTCTFFGGGIEAKSDSSSSLGIAAELRAVTMAAAQVSIREFLWWKTLRLARKRSAFSVVFQWGRSISPLKRLCCYWYKTIFCTIFQNRQASIIPSISFLGGFHRKRGFWYIENITTSPYNF